MSGNLEILRKSLGELQEVISAFEERHAIVPFDVETAVPNGVLRWARWEKGNGRFRLLLKTETDEKPLAEFKIAERVQGAIGMPALAKAIDERIGKFIESLNQQVAGLK